MMLVLLIYGLHFKYQTKTFYHDFLGGQSNFSDTHEFPTHDYEKKKKKTLLRENIEKIWEIAVLSSRE